MKKRTEQKKENKEYENKKEELIATEAKDED